MSNPSPELNPQPQPQPNAAAIELLYNNLASLPHDEYGVINMLPFAHDSAAVRTIKRHTSEAIIGLLDAHGFLRDKTDTAPQVSDVAVLCRSCGNTLVVLPVTEGAARVDAPGYIRSMASLNGECPHAPTTLDDMRRNMERQFYESTCAECGVADLPLKDGLCNNCTKARKGQQQ
jgi:hypothetical protein